MSRQMYWDEEAHQFFPVDGVPQEPVKPTNVDRIRAMSDAELAKEILQLMIFIVDTVVSITGLDIKVVFKDDCVQFWLDWLNEEVKE